MAVGGDGDALAVGGDDVGAAQAVGGEAVAAGSGPNPPPSVKPATPTVGLEPAIGASPNGAAAATMSPIRAPGPTRAIRRSGSTSTSAIREVLSSRPPSAGTCVPWPVACTANGRPCVRATTTAACTSAADIASATTAGRWSSAPFQVARAALYAWSPGR